MAFGIDIDFNAQVGKLTTQVDKISNDLGRFEKKAESISRNVNRSLSTLGVGISVAGLAAFVKSGIDAADAISKLSTRTGIAVEDLKGLELAANLSDTNLETLGRTVNRLSISIASSREEFQKLGISAKDPTEAFLQFADVFSSIENAQDRAAFGNKVLGRSYAELAPLLNQGSEAIRAQVIEGRELSNLTTEQAEKAAAFNDELTRLSATFDGFQTRISIGVLDPLVRMGTIIDENIKKSGVLRGVWLGLIDTFKQSVGLNTGLEGEIDVIDRQIVKVRQAIKNLEGSFFTGLVEGKETELNELYEKRFELVKQISAERAKGVEQETRSPAVDVSEFIKVKTTTEDASVAMSDLEKAAQRVFEQTRTPLEQYNAKLSELNNLLSVGSITQETYNRAVANARSAISGKSEAIKELTESEAFQLKQLQDSLAIFERQAQLDIQNPYLQAQGISDQEAAKQLQKAQDISQQIALLMGETPVPIALQIPESELNFPELENKKADIEISPIINTDTLLSKIEAAIQIVQQQIQPLIVPVDYQVIGGAPGQGIADQIARESLARGRR